MRTPPIKIRQNSLILNFYSQLLKRGAGSFVSRDPLSPMREPPPPPIKDRQNSLINNKGLLQPTFEEDTGCFVLDGPGVITDHATSDSI